MKPNRAADKRVSWTVRDAILALICELLLAAVLLVTANTLLERFLGISFVEMANGNAWTVFFVFLVQNAVLLLALWFFCIKRYKPSLALLGFRAVKPGAAAILVVAAFLLNLAITALYNTFSSYYQFDLPGYGIQEPHLPIFGANPTGMILLVIVAVIIAPVIEEVFFRGFLQQAFTKRFGLNRGLLLASLIFAIAHFEFQVLIPIFILSLLLGWMFIRSRSIWPGIIFHAVNNIMALVIEFMVLDVL